MRQPTFDDIRRFCEIDEWTIKTSARGKTGDHDRYVKHLPDGRILRTKASHSKEQIKDPDLWHRIWKEQLGLENADRFWNALATRKPVVRAAQVSPPSRGIPEWLVQRLIQTVGLSEADVLALSQDEARRRWEAYITSPKEPLEPEGATAAIDGYEGRSDSL